MLPLANEGEALFHIARFDDVDEVESNVSLFQDSYDPLGTPGT
jgi:hypothetical protein